MILGQGCDKVIEIGGLVLVACCLLAASVMDVKTKNVYNFLWWPIGVFGMLRIFMPLNVEKLPETLLSVLIFGLLQEGFFCRMYGRADCHGFLVCALWGASYGMLLKEYLMHMLIAFGLLGLVQAVRGNVERRGNLKEPVPFIPYLSIAFWVNLGVYLCV